MGATEAGLFMLLRARSAEFRQLAERHREVDQKISAYDRIYYLTSEQERKHKELQTEKFNLKNEMSRIMRLYAETNGRHGRRASGSARASNLTQAASATT
jgi:uncharacterized protein YdcH (DUF465 family)